MKTYRISPEARLRLKEIELELDTIVSMYYEWQEKPKSFDKMAYSEVMNRLENMSNELLSINL